MTNRDIRGEKPGLRSPHLTAACFPNQAGGSRHTCAHSISTALAEATGPGTHRDVARDLEPTKAGQEPTPGLQKGRVDASEPRKGEAGVQRQPPPSTGLLCDFGVIPGVVVTAAAVLPSAVNHK